MGNSISSANSSPIVSLTSIPKSPAQIRTQIQQHVKILRETMALGRYLPGEDLREREERLRKEEAGMAQSAVSTEVDATFADTDTSQSITLRTILQKYEELVPIKLHVVMFYEWAAQLMNVLREEEMANNVSAGGDSERVSVVKVTNAEHSTTIDDAPPVDMVKKPNEAMSHLQQQPNNPGAQHLELSPQWTEFLIELLKRAVESFELYCVPVSANNGDFLEMEQAQKSKDEKKPKKDDIHNVHTVDEKDSDEVHAVVESQSSKTHQNATPNDKKCEEKKATTKSSIPGTQNHPTQSPTTKSSSTEESPTDTFKDRTSSNSLQEYLSQHFPQIDPSALKQDSSLHELYVYYLKSHVQLAHLLFERKHYKEALTHYIAGQYRNHFRLACLYYGIDEYAEAIAEYKKIPSYDQDIYTLNNIGVAHDEMGEWEQAKKYYERALNLNPDYGMARLNLRTVQWKIEQRKKYSSKSGSQANIEDIQDLGFGGVSSSDTKLKVLLRKMSLGIVTHMEYSRLSDEAYYYLPSLTSAATSSSSNKHHTHTPHQRILPPQWEILTTADRVSLARNGYFSIAFVNHLSRCVVISTRGTDDGAGVRADFWLTFDEFSIQFALARGFSRMVRLIMRDRGIGSYRVSYTGHSLGAAIGAFLCWEEQVSGVTFDSPGCRKLIETEILRRLTRNRENPAHEVQETLPHAIDPFSVDVVSYLTAPNLINTIKPHIGLRIRIFPSSIDDPSQQATAATQNLKAPLPFYVRWVAPTTALQSFEYVYKELEKLIHHTSHQHVMKNIVKTLSEPNPKERVLSWPCGPFQCWTFYKGFPKLAQYTHTSQEASVVMGQQRHNHVAHKTSKALPDPKHSNGHKPQQQHTTEHTPEQEEILRSVFEDSVQNMAQYRTTYYDESVIPLNFLSLDEITILKQFATLGEHPEILSSQNTKLLCSYVVEGNTLRVTSFLTGCEFKQFIKINKHIMEDLIRKYSTPDLVGTEILSKGAILSGKKLVGPKVTAPGPPVPMITAKL
mmetsp:Transcript_10195/g.37899  ORF Transcript_10195/g.37899 Transcript_10195/m.37899 type:complete len:1014 (-) Transcript_10195:29-3070(-)